MGFAIDRLGTVRKLRQTRVLLAKSGRHLLKASTVSHPS
jgi:hypothetical protein